MDKMKAKRMEIARKAIAQKDLMDVKTPEEAEEWAKSQKGSPEHPFEDWLQFAREFNPRAFHKKAAKEVVPAPTLHGSPEK